MPIAALVLSAVWVSIALVLRVLLQVRRTGDTGVRLLSGARWSLEWWAVVGTTTGLVLVVLGPALAVAGAVEAAAVSGRASWVGALVAGAGVIATFVAQLGMGASWRIGVDPSERTALVTVGTFSLVRNPIFTTMIATAGGICLMAPTAVGVVGLVVLVAAIEAQVRGVEEPYLRVVHGDAYLAYTASVGRFVPLVGRAT